MADEKPQTDRSMNTKDGIAPATGADKAADPSKTRERVKPANVKTSTGIVATLMADGQAYDLALKHGGMDLINRLKAFYARVYGVVHEDMVDWHWIATALKNHTVNHVIENKETGNDSTQPKSAESPSGAERPTGESPDAANAPPTDAKDVPITVTSTRNFEAPLTSDGKSVDPKQQNRPVVEQLPETD